NHWPEQRAGRPITAMMTNTSTSRRAVSLCRSTLCTHGCAGVSLVSLIRCICSRGYCVGTAGPSLFALLRREILPFLDPPALRCLHVEIFVMAAVIPEVRQAGYAVFGRRQFQTGVAKRPIVATHRRIARTDRAVIRT